MKVTCAFFVTTESYIFTLWTLGVTSHFTLLYEVQTTTPPLPLQHWWEPRTP